MKLNHVNHLYRRAGFGLTPKEAESMAVRSKEDVIDLLFKESEDYTPLEMDLSPFTDFFRNNPNATYKQFKPIFEKNKELRVPLNKAWLKRICDPTEALNERMTLFWSNIFVCQDLIVPYVLQFNNTLRKHALGNFKDMAKAVSKEPAMLRFLNTNRNKKNHPNENFARELMELFTLGVGNYTEEDIKEAARAFTGYTHYPDGKFRMILRNHDFGTKEFFGYKGNLDGDDIINIIAKKKECARFICSKVYSYFVHENIDENRVEELVDVFYPNYEISDLMYYLFSAEWFYEKDNIGTKIKSPMDLLASIHKVVPFHFTEDKQHIFLQRLLGQVLFNPPNVAGWKGGKNWIDTNTILVRLKLPSLLLGNGLIPFSGLSYTLDYIPFGNRLRVESDWTYFNEHFGNLSAEAIANALVSEVENNPESSLIETLNGKNREDFSIQLMSTPEFQLT